jgi:hypothetical protein
MATMIMAPKTAPRLPRVSATPPERAADADLLDDRRRHGGRERAHGDQPRNQEQDQASRHHEADHDAHDEHEEERAEADLERAPDRDRPAPEILEDRVRDGAGEDRAEHDVGGNRDPLEVPQHLGRRLAREEQERQRDERRVHGERQDGERNEAPDPDGERPRDDRSDGEPERQGWTAPNELRRGGSRRSAGGRRPLRQVGRQWGAVFGSGHGARCLRSSGPRDGRRRYRGAARRASPGGARDRRARERI